MIIKVHFTPINQSISLSLGKLWVKKRFYKKEHVKVFPLSHENGHRILAIKPISSIKWYELIHLVLTH